jgi:hypothetical protein
MIKINWHRLFGLTLIDLLTDTSYEVELEKELSLKKQFLDIVIVRKQPNAATVELPVGLDNLAEHNLLTYKSFQESLNSWTIEELIGYYSNYRKIISPSLNKLLPAEYFQLYAISTRYPTKLLNDQITFHEVQQGVFDLQWGNRLIRLIVLTQIELSERNAFWLLFSGKAQQFMYAEQHYQWRCPAERAVLNQLYEWYQHHGVVMPYTMEDFTRDFTKEHLHLLPPKDRLEGLPAKVRLEGLPAKDRLEGLPAKVRLEGLPAKDRLEGLPPEAVFSQFSTEEIYTYLEKLKKQQDN